MRVLEVVANGGAGGTQIIVARLATGLVDAGVDVTVAAGPPPPMASGDVAWQPLLNFDRRQLGGAAFVRSLRAIIRATEPAFIHGHGLRLAPALAVAAPLTPKAVTCHGIDPTAVNPTARVAWATRVPVISCGLGPARLLAAHGLDSTVLPVGIPEAPEPLDRGALCHELGIDPTTFFVVSPIRLSPQKDPVTVVRAMAKVPNATLVLFGDGPERAEVERTIAREHLGSRVRICGWRSDLGRVLASADALLLGSRWEGHVLVALEAMQARVPVVATSCVGIADWIDDGRNGLLAPVGDAAGLGRALVRVSSDNDLRAQLIDAGARTAARYSIQAMVNAHLDYYRRRIAP